MTFQGSLEGPELAFVIEIGLNKLMLDGALPFLSIQKRNKASIVGGSETVN